MTTTQSKDPHEQVNHPRHYNQHPSGVETIEIIEHLPGNLCNAIKYVWRCGLKQTSTPLRDLRSAEWYVRREIWRREHFNLGDKLLKSLWREAAERVIADAWSRAKGDEHLHDLLALCLNDLLNDDLEGLAKRLEKAILGAW